MTPTCRESLLIDHMKRAWGLGGVAVSLWIVAVATVTAAGPDALPRSDPGSVGLSVARLGEATDLMRRHVTEKKIAGAVAAVARRGRLAYLESVGVQDLESGTPMTERSVFRIYSMSKAVTAAAVMMLWEQGRFRLDDPVSKYLPEFRDVTVLVATDGSTRQPSRAITIEDLLLHTSGLNHRTSDVYRRAQVRSRSVALPRFVADIARVPLMEDPGTRYRYSESTTVLGRLVEIWSGRLLDEFLREQVFRPLGMVGTAFWVSSDQRNRLATVYSGQAGALRPVELEAVPFTERPALLEGAVGLVSTVPDYLRFCQMLLNGGTLDGARLLRNETVDMMTVNRLPDPFVKSRRGQLGWALGNVEVVTDPGAVDYAASRGEYGWNGSAGTIFWVDPALEMITIVMTQSSPANPDSLWQRFKTLVHRSIAS